LKTNNIDVCLSPNLIDLYDLEGKIVVVVDILRATSVMVTALAHGADCIIPVANLEEAKSHQSQGYLCAAERGGARVDGFPLDNSPFSYMNDSIKGKAIVITTTNGTLAISRSLKAQEVLIGAFLNISALADYIKTRKLGVIIHCAGWKGKPNMEDTLFAGALIEQLGGSFDLACDTAHLALHYYQNVKGDLLSVVTQSSHAKRLGKLNIFEDIAFCTTLDKYAIVPKLEGLKIKTVESW